MPQLFPPSSRRRFRQIITLVVCVCLLVLGGIYYNAFRQWEYSPEQPVEFSHRVHAKLGMNCSFCHSFALRSSKAGTPDAQSCMDCHRHIMPDSPRIAPIRKSADPSYPQYNGKRIEWVMVNTWAGHARFSHQAHTSRGVGCTECHGDIAGMDTVSSPQNRGMRWCIECHQAPSSSLRPLNALFRTDYTPGHLRRQGSNKQASPHPLGEILEKRWNISPPINDCSACHY